MLAVGLSVGETLADIRRRRHRLAADVENDVADLEAMLGGNPTVGYAGDDNAGTAGILVGGRERQAELRHVGVDRVVLGVLIVRRYLFGRQRTERQGHGLVLTAMDGAELHRRAGRHGADLARQFAGVVDRRAVDGDDDIAALDARGGGRAVLLRLGDERARRLFKAHAVGDIGRQGLGLDAGSAAGGAAFVA